MMSPKWNEIIAVAVRNHPELCGPGSEFDQVVGDIYQSFLTWRRSIPSKDVSASECMDKLCEIMRSHERRGGS